MVHLLLTLPALLLSILPCIARDTHQRTPHIPEIGTHEAFFTNEIIEKLDGAKLGNVTYGIDGPTIHDILWLLQRMNDMVKGHEDAHGKTVKKYIFESQPCTLLELYKKEKLTSAKTADDHRAALLKACKGETTEFKKRWQEFELTRAHQIAEIQKTLAVIKKDFEATTTPFMISVRIFKSLICQLIEEWCKRTQHEDSFLLTWHSAEENEFGIFHKEITSAHGMLQLMADLKDFLTKLIHSCPRAWQEFTEHQHEYSHPSHPGH